MVQRLQTPSNDQNSSSSRKENVSSSPGDGNENGRISLLEAERDELKRYLKSAQQRIQELEISQGAIVTRIDAVISALGSVVEKKF